MTGTVDQLSLLSPPVVNLPAGKIKHCRVCGRRLYHPDSSEVESEEAAPGVRNWRQPGGFDTICRGCNAARVRAHQQARRAAGQCHVLGCPNQAVSGRGGLCERHADEQAARDRARHAANREADRAADRARREQYRARSLDQVTADCERLHPTGLKHCPTCDRDLPLAAFTVSIAAADGLERRCRTCHSRRARLRGEAVAAWESESPPVTTGARYWQRGRCYLCLGLLNGRWTVDHIVPGGDDSPANLAPAHPRCNSRKHRRPAAAAAADIRASVDLAAVDGELMETIMGEVRAVLEAASPE